MKAPVDTKVAKRKSTSTFDIKRALWDEERLNKQAALFRKSVCLKLSLYDSTLYDFAAVCLLSNNSDNRFTDINRRFDLVQQDGQIKLANTSQDVCARCQGARALSEQSCTCEFAGFMLTKRYRPNRFTHRDSPIRARPYQRSQTLTTPTASPSAG